MASELSKLIDDELEKVGQETDASRPARSAFQIKAGQSGSHQPTWREFTWWTRPRLIFAGIGSLLVVIILLFLFSHSGKSATSGTTASTNSLSEVSKSAVSEALQTAANALGPSFDFASSITGAVSPNLAPLPGLASTSSALSPTLANLNADAPGPSSILSTGMSSADAPGPGSTLGSIEALDAPVPSPSLEAPSNAGLIITNFSDIPKHSNHGRRLKLDIRSDSLQD